ncbi:DUF2242 domain-containing protein [Ottowia sp.]|uniref:DUF2242 domain-containing protein n=2 Tax=unclassified Ottowia TaxID=2645081 RepID=UPI003C71EB6E
MLLPVRMPFDSLSRRATCWLLAPVLVLGGCAGLSRNPAPLINYKPETFGASTYSRRFAANPAQTCEAARRALLGQGYIVVSAAAEQVTARKFFQPNPDHHVQLEFRVVCAAEVGEGGDTIAFANGLQDQYNVRKVKESASLGVGGFGSLSLPVEGGTDTMVKVASETVTDERLYQSFFDLLAGYLDSVIPPEPVKPPEPAKPSEPAKTPEPSKTPEPATPPEPTTPPEQVQSAGLAKPSEPDVLLESSKPPELPASTASQAER